MFTISWFLICKLAINLISIENSPSAEIGQVTNITGFGSVVDIGH
jgi:hypothetical protein